jgi:hypothetical protein
MHYYGYPHYKPADNQDKSHPNSNLPNRNPIYQAPHMNPQMMAVFQQMQYHQNAAMYGVPANMPGSLPRKDSISKKKKKEKRSSSSSSSSSESKSRSRSHHHKKKKRAKSNSISRSKSKNSHQKRKTSNAEVRLEENNNKIENRKNSNLGTDKKNEVYKFNKIGNQQRKYSGQMVKYSPPRNLASNITSNSNSHERKKYFDLKLVNSYTELSRNNSRNLGNEVNLNDENSIQFEKKEIKQRRLSNELSSSSSHYTQEGLIETTYQDINAVIKDNLEKRSRSSSLKDLHLEENLSNELEYSNLKAEKEDYVKNLSLEIKHKDSEGDYNIHSRKRKRDEDFYIKSHYERSGSRSISKSKSKSRSRYGDSFTDKRQNRYSTYRYQNNYSKDYYSKGNSSNFYNNQNYRDKYNDRFFDKEKTFKERDGDSSYNRIGFKEYDRYNIRDKELDRDKEYSIHRSKEDKLDSYNSYNKFRDYNYYDKNKERDREEKFRYSSTSYSSSKYHKIYQGNKFSSNNYFKKNYYTDKSQSKYSEDGYIESASFQPKKEDNEELEKRDNRDVKEEKLDESRYHSIPEEIRMNENKREILSQNNLTTTPQESKIIQESSNIETPTEEKISSLNKRKVHSNFSDAPPQIEIKSLSYSKRKSNFAKEPPIDYKSSYDQEINRENTSHEQSSSLSNQNSYIFSNERTDGNKEDGEVRSRKNFKVKNYSSFMYNNRRISINREKLKIINESGKKKIILNKERKNPDVKVIKRDK